MYHLIHLKNSYGTNSFIYCCCHLINTFQTHSIIFYIWFSLPLYFTRVKYFIYILYYLFYVQYIKLYFNQLTVIKYELV